MADRYELSTEQAHRLETEFVDRVSLVAVSYALADISRYRD